MINIESNIDEINIQFNTNLFELKKSVLTDISEIVRSDNEDNLLSGRSFDGSAIKSKVIPNGKAIFRDKEILIFSVMKKVNSDFAEVFIDDFRKQEASWLFYGTSKMPARRFFGISQKIDSAIENYFGNKSITELFEL